MTEVPLLSSSVESVAENEKALEFNSDSEPISRPSIVPRESLASPLRQRHGSSERLTKTIVSIDQEEGNIALLREISFKSKADESQAGFFFRDTQQILKSPNTPAGSAARCSG
jgi:excinuclease UvrABC ATPase subunit